MSSILSGFEYDIFISYRQKDNKYDGWVMEFVDNLKRELEATFKEEISVYFDINPHDGLLETHDVNASLKEKLKCLVFIPIISQTYCDTKSFAWEHEFKAFIELASTEQFGLKVKLPGGNVASRILPVQIHDLDTDDKKLLENELGGVLRAIEFIYKEAGVNRPLRSNEENPAKNLNQTIYRNQVNKVANAIKDIINGIKFPSQSSNQKAGRETIKHQKPQSIKKALLVIPIFILLLIAGSYFLFHKWFLIGSSDKSIEKSIAVLAFTDMSPGHDQEYLGEGIAAEIHDRLNKLGDLKVVAKTSAFSFKGKNEDIRQIGSKLNADLILEGSVQREKTRVRVTIQLTNTENGYNLFSETYDEEFKNILSLQSDIALAVAGKVKSHLSAVEKQLLIERKEVNPQAYEAYLKGRYELAKDFPRSNIEKAKKYFEAAVDSDPGFSTAYGFLSITYSTLSNWANILQGKKRMIDSAEFFAKKAISLGENNSISHLALGIVCQYNYDWVNSTNEIDKAYSLNPGGSLEKIQKALCTVFLDANYDEGIRQAKSAADMDPLNPGTILYYAYVLYYAGRYDESIARSNEAFVLDSISFGVSTSNNIGFCYVAKKDYKKALQSFSRHNQLVGRKELAEIFMKSDFKTAMEAYVKFASDTTRKDIFAQDYVIAYVYAFLKDRENTLKYLFGAFRNYENLVDMKNWYGFDFLRKDSSFIALYEKAGFKAYDEYKAGLKK